jgi:hypothetical protein
MENLLYFLGVAIGLLLMLFLGRWVGAMMGSWAAKRLDTAASRVAKALLQLQLQDPTLVESIAVVEKLYSDLKGDVTREQILAVLAFTHGWHGDAWDRVTINYAVIQRLVERDPTHAVLLQSLPLGELGKRDFNGVTDDLVGRVLESPGATEPVPPPCRDESEDDIVSRAMAFRREMMESLGGQWPMPEPERREVTFYVVKGRIAPEPASGGPAIEVGKQ